LNQYELAVLFDPQLEIDLSKPSAKLEKLIKDNDGKILKTDNWGKRKLAYDIGKQEYAVYVFYTIELPPTNIQKVESTLNITDEVLRYLITRLDQKVLAKIEAAKAAKAKAEKAAEAHREENE
jgi:small subunit ribosomal protein S6